MKFTIKSIAPLTTLDDNRKPMVLNGFAFIDEEGRTIIMAYGENRRDMLEKYLSDDGDDLLGMKYHYIDLKNLKKKL